MPLTIAVRCIKLPSKGGANNTDTKSLTTKNVIFSWRYCCI